MSLRPARSGNGWECRWWENGRQRSRVFPRKRDAQIWDREVASRKALGPLAVRQLTAKSPTMDAWIAECWQPEHGSTLQQSTLDRYAEVYARYVEPYLGDVPLNEISVGTLRSWQAGLLMAQDGRQAVSTGTIRKARTFVSSVLRHAAESEAITGNPLLLVRAPKAEQKDAVEALAPRTVEDVRLAMLNPPRRAVAASRPGQRARAGYALAAPGAPRTWSRDALIVSLMAYAGLRPGELRALRWNDIQENTIRVQRALGPDGAIKPTKTGKRRTVCLLPALAQDLREHRMAVGQPPADELIISTDGAPWTKTDWQIWRKDRWLPACQVAGIRPAPRPYDLRHSFASLLLAAGKQQLYVARQMGHSLQVLSDTYAHLIDEYHDLGLVDAEQEIADARSAAARGRLIGRARPGGAAPAEPRRRSA